MVVTLGEIVQLLLEPGDCHAPLRLISIRDANYIFEYVFFIILHSIFVYKIKYENLLSFDPLGNNLAITVEAFAQDHISSRYS